MAKRPLTPTAEHSLEVSLTSSPKTKAPPTVNHQAHVVQADQRIPDLDDLIGLLSAPTPAARPTAAQATSHAYFAVLYQGTQEEEHQCCISSNTLVLSSGLLCSDGRASWSTFVPCVSAPWPRLAVPKRLRLLYAPQRRLKPTSMWPQRVPKMTAPKLAGARTSPARTASCATYISRRWMNCARVAAWQVRRATRWHRGLCKALCMACLVTARLLLRHHP